MDDFDSNGISWIRIVRRGGVLGAVDGPIHGRHPGFGALGDAVHDPVQYLYFVQAKSATAHVRAARPFCPARFLALPRGQIVRDDVIEDIGHRHGAAAIRPRPSAVGQPGGQQFLSVLVDLDPTSRTRGQMIQQFPVDTLDGGGRKSRNLQAGRAAPRRLGARVLRVEPPESLQLSRLEVQHANRAEILGASPTMIHVNRDGRRDSDPARRDQQGRQKGLDLRARHALAQVPEVEVQGINYIRVHSSLPKMSLAFCPCKGLLKTPDLHPAKQTPAHVPHD